MKHLQKLLILLTLLLPLTWAGLVEEARKQIGVTTSYDPSYVVLKYPAGDVAANTGVCTDVIIRAMRGCGLDLQVAVHEDMKKSFASYPNNWGLKRPDKNIDHRRVPNLKCYFKRQSWAIAVPKGKLPTDLHAGDILTCTLPPSLPHIMIVSDRKSAEGHPLIIHNVGAGAQEEDFITAFPIDGHYRPVWK